MKLSNDIKINSITPIEGGYLILSVSNSQGDFLVRISSAAIGHIDAEDLENPYFQGPK